MTTPLDAFRIIQDSGLSATEVLILLAVLRSVDSTTMTGWKDQKTLAHWAHVNPRILRDYWKGLVSIGAIQEHGVTSSGCRKFSINVHVLTPDLRSTGSRIRRGGRIQDPGGADPGSVGPDPRSAQSGSRILHTAPTAPLCPNTAQPAVDTPAEPPPVFTHPEGSEGATPKRQRVKKPTDPRVKRVQDLWGKAHREVLGKTYKWSSKEGVGIIGEDKSATAGIIDLLKLPEHDGVDRWDALDAAFRRYLTAYKRGETFPTQDVPSLSRWQKKWRDWTETAQVADDGSEPWKLIQRHVRMNGGRSPRSWGPDDARIRAALKEIGGIQAVGDANEFETTRLQKAWGPAWRATA